MLGTRIFCILTHTDRATTEQQEDVRNVVQNQLRIPAVRIFDVVNYTDPDIRVDYSTKKDLNKEEKALNALLGLIQPASTPRFARKP